MVPTLAMLLNLVIALKLADLDEPTTLLQAIAVLGFLTFAIATLQSRGNPT